MRLLFALMVFVSTVSFSQTIVINEFMSDNNAWFFDEDNDDSDWIEIFNVSSQPVLMSDYFLSDDYNNLQKWRFPEFLLPAGSYLIVFASGKDRAEAGNQLHTNFKISASGEHLFLSDYETVVHSLPAVSLRENYSFGLNPNGTGLLHNFSCPTPGYNNAEGDLYYPSLFSHQGGFYEDVVTLELTTSNLPGHIRYTTDGSLPDENSMIYSVPLLLDSSLQSPSDMSSILLSPPELFFLPEQRPENVIIITAAVFNDSNRIVSHPETHTYFIESLGVSHHSGFAVISLSAQYNDLFCDTIGIMVPGIYWDEENPLWTGNYFNRGDQWERDIRFEFFDAENSSQIRQNAGLRIHGGNMRRFSQKGLRLYARDDYGSKYFNYRFFPSKNIDKYKRLVLIPFASSWSDAGSENYISLMLSASLNFESLQIRPAILYINGEYRGMYFLQERIDKHFLSDYHQLPKDSIDLMENWSGYAEYGDNEEFMKLYYFIEQNDLSDSENYNYVKSIMDVESFIDYQIFQIYLTNYDWPANNVRCWRERREGSKFRWIFFDGDAGLHDFEFNGFNHALSTSDQTWPTNSISTLFLRKLMENNTFSDAFFSRFEHHLNNTFTLNKVIPVFQHIYSLMKDEAAQQSALYGVPESFYTWADAMNEINEFFIFRSCMIKEHVRERFGVKLRIPECEPWALQLSDFSLYPNPCDGAFTLDFHSKENGSAKAIIYNVEGKQIVSEEVYVFSGSNRLEFEINDLRTGVYYVTISSANKLFTSKFIVIP